MPLLSPSSPSAPLARGSRATSVSTRIVAIRSPAMKQVWSEPPPSQRHASEISGSPVGLVAERNPPPSTLVMGFAFSKPFLPCYLLRIRRTLAARCRIAQRITILLIFFHNFIPKIFRPDLLLKLYLPQDSVIRLLVAFCQIFEKGDWI